MATRGCDGAARLRLIGLLACAIVIAAPAAHAAPVTGARLTLAAGVGAGYDNNILRYSDEQLLLFEGGTRPDEFSIKTRDDLIWTPYAAATWEQRRPGGRRRSFRIRGDGDFHSKNPTADFRSISGSWREGFGDWLFYGIASGDQKKVFTTWHLIDLDAVRYHMIRHARMISDLHIQNCHQQYDQQRHGQHASQRSERTGQTKETATYHQR